jgi:hypothetical protein
VHLKNRLERKQRLLKLVLKIKSDALHKNLKQDAKKGWPNYRLKKEPRAVAEYLLCGREVQRLNTELAALRGVRKAVAEANKEHVRFF